MYEKFFGFKEKPFRLVPEPRFFYMSTAHRAALCHLQYGLEDRNGIVAVTGEVGSGKTLLLRILMDSVPRTFVVARVFNTNLDPKELLQQILHEFGVEAEGASKPKMLALLNDFLIRCYGRRREVVLIIDEAQNLSVEALEEVRMLSNLETKTDKLIQIFLVGQPQLREKLRLAQLEQLRQRITVHYHLSAMEEEDTFKYVHHRLALGTGVPVKLFTQEALKRIHEYSGGIPRLINLAADAALRFGFAEDKKIIDSSILDEVIRELGDVGTLAEAPPPQRPRASTRPNGQVAEAGGECRILELKPKKKPGN